MKMNYRASSSAFLLGAIALLFIGVDCRPVEAQDASKTSATNLTDAEVRETILRVAHHQMVPLRDGDYSPVTTLAAAQQAAEPAGITWNNPYGVMLYGELRAAEALGDKESREFVLKHNQIASRYYAWLKSLPATLTNVSSTQIEQFQNSTALNELMTFDKQGVMDPCATMGIAVLEGILHHADQSPSPEEKQLVQDIAEYIVHRQPRLPDGTFWRASWRGTVWADDLYKGCAFLTRWSEFTGDPKYLDDAANQIINTSKLLQDKDGLWFHGYFYNEHKSNGAKWGRANGWAMIGTVETLSALPANHPASPKILEILRRQIDGVEKVQARSGMWRQLLDRPESWEETSGTALFSYCIARASARGWIDATNMVVARKAFAAVCKHVKPDGAVTDVCEASGIFWGDYDFYMNRKRPEDEMHGRGPVMLAGAEILLASRTNTPAKRP